MNYIYKRNELASLSPKLTSIIFFPLKCCHPRHRKLLSCVCVCVASNRTSSWFEFEFSVTKGIVCHTRVRTWSTIQGQACLTSEQGVSFKDFFEFVVFYKKKKKIRAAAQGRKKKKLGGASYKSED